MTTERVELKATPRQVLGKKTRALRASGIVPIHMYGLDGNPLSLQAESRHLRAVLQAAGRTTPVTLAVEGGEQTVTLVRDIARHPVSGEILHVDFLRVDIQQTVHAPVPVVLVNQEEAPGTRGGQGVVTQGLHEITVEARPFDVPHVIEIDCMVLEEIDSIVHLGDVALPPGVTLVGDPEDRVAWVQPPRVTAEEEPEVPVEEAELAEGEEAPADEAEEGAERPSDSSEESDQES